MSEVIGRKLEIINIKQILTSNKSEFMVVYGRRRVGKTFLVRSLFKPNSLFLEFTGVKKAPMQKQLAQFEQKLKSYFNFDADAENYQFGSWMNALYALTESIKKHKSKEKVSLFFDELPWLASPRSGLLDAIDYYWNTEWSQMPLLKVVVCGSAASWIMDKVVNAKGGLHNRLTARMHLQPFDLGETVEFFKQRGFKYTLKQVVDVYMVVGGVPLYLEQFEKSKSVNQNIDSICFDSNGLLIDEFDRLFKALFDHSEAHEQIVRLLANHRYGLSRTELLKVSWLNSGGLFNKRIDELEASGFIKRYIPYGKKKRNVFYRLTDEYTLFYLNWIEESRLTGHQQQQNYWQSQSQKPAWLSWSGYSFEGICLFHQRRIAEMIGLKNIGYTAYSWKNQDASNGAQIDLLFDRDDDIIMIFEIKYNRKSISVDKAMAMNLMNKINQFQQETKTKKQIMLVMLTLNELKKSIWETELVDLKITLEEFL